MDTNASQHVLITGAGRGLGRDLATRFLRGGFQVHAGVRGSADSLQDLRQAYGPRLNVVALDVTEMGSIRQAVSQVSRLTPALDILINNAAVYLSEKPPRRLSELDLTDGHLEQSLNVNAFGPLRVTQQFLPLLAKGTRKLILNVSSEAGSLGACGRTGEYAYCMSKAALNMQSIILHNDLAPQGFRVLAVHPGWMRTDMGGPEADIAPAEAAEALFDLALKPQQTGDPMYLDYLGRPLPW